MRPTLHGHAPTLLLRLLRLPLLVFGLSVSLSVSLSAAAADPAGRFVIKGAANSSCGEFLTAYDDKQGAFLLYLGWLGGYVTAFNQLQKETYDLAAWESMGLLATAMHGYCRKHPDTAFFTALGELTEALEPDRLTQFSPAISISNRGVTLRVNRDVLTRVHQRLIDDGLYAGDPGAAFGDESKAAIAAYQTKHGLRTTGLPDQLTLFQMFRKRASPAAAAP